MSSAGHRENGSRAGGVIRVCLVIQSGTQVTATNMSYNGAIGGNGTVSFGFNGSWSGSNPPPTSFALNGVTCTGPQQPRPDADLHHPTADTRLDAGRPAVREH